MRHPARFAALAIVAALALPTAAAAHERPSSASVRQHANAADRALEMTAARVRAGKDDSAARTLARHRRQLRAARREAGRLERAARRGGSVRRAVAAERAVGTVASDCVDTLSAVLGQAGSPAQLDLAQAIRSCVVIRQLVIDTLTGLLEVVPAPARPIIAQLIAALSTGGFAGVTAIGGALDTPGLPPEVALALTQALAAATQAIELATSQLAAIVPLLPAVAQPIVQQALKLVTQQLQQVTALVENLIGGILGGRPVPGRTPGSPTAGGGFGIPGLGLLNGILGGLLSR